MIRLNRPETDEARRRNRRGSNAVEFALLVPWYLFLFIGAFDFGFYSYSLIATQNAARVVGMYCSGSAKAVPPTAPTPAGMRWISFASFPMSAPERRRAGRRRWGGHYIRNGRAPTWLAARAGHRGIHNAPS